jgi:uncharacterized membrane protein/predicted DsbA family dithiol-disulfide isomerase
MNQPARRLALAFSVVGLTVSAIAAYVHHQMLGNPTYTSFCDVSATVSCTQVYASRFGSFQGVPVSVFGAVWFAFATLLSWAWLREQPAAGESSVPGVLFAGSTLALAVALYLGYASFVILKLVCVLCVITYAAVIGLFLVTGAAASLPMLSLPRRAAHDLKALGSSPTAVVLALLWVVGSVSALALFPRDVAATAAAGTMPEPSQDQRSELERFLSSAPRVPLAVTAEGAKVLIVKFADYQCPACGQAYTAYKPILAKYAASHPGQVRMVMKDYPLNSACNPNVRTALHSAACEAAVAVRLAQAKGKGDALEEYFYTHQPEMTPASVREAARSIGGVTDFDAKYESTLALVKGDIALGQGLKVSQTPTFFLNGVKIDGAWAPQFFDQAIAYELRRAQ